MEERESTELCEGCPYKYLPKIDDNVITVLDIYKNTFRWRGSVDSIIEAYKPNLTRFDYLQIIQGLNEVDNTLNEIRRKKENNNGSTN